ncbi:MAG: type IX secretion system sortase PorU [Muribaculaceae bacterium]|nr:type IX secretion system sortase PorU [Muribaculaceae bacterium]
MFTLNAHALPSGFFAENSVLAAGKWVKVSVPSTGMCLIPAARLREMGFNDISKVNVYGTGGRMLPEYLNETITDDLPLLPSIKGEKGIIFFATGVESWEKGADVPYTHTLNPYDTNSYYFLSDREPETSAPFLSSEAPGADTEPLTVFTDRLLHEVEKVNPADSGRTLFGEDFRSSRSISFPFTLTGNTGAPATVKVRFGAKASSESSIIISANGSRLPATNSDQIKASIGTSEFCKMINSVKSIENPADKMNIEISYTASGAVSFARLDYIELFYERELALENGSLLFHFSLDEPRTALIKGATASTRIWDVTDPSAPKEMKADHSAAGARIAVGKGYREYVAFDPDRVAAPAVTWENVANQNIHALEIPDMLIISYDTYMEGARRIAALHEQHDGMKVTILRPEDIYNEFSGGSVEVTAFRRLLKMWHDRGNGSGVRYCLLMGRPHFDNRMLTEESRNLGYRPLPIWQEPRLFTETGSYSMDAYIAMLDDSNPGFNFSSARLHTAVGRLPVRSAEEAEQMAAKIEKYVLNPDYGAWRNRMLIVADDIDDAGMADVKPASLSAFFDQSQAIYEILKNSENGKRYIFERIFLDAFKLEYTNIGASYPTAKSKLLSTLNDGVVYTNYLGHANPRSWTHEGVLDWDDINSFSNRNLTFLFGGTCEFARWDTNELTGGEIMVLNPNAGAIAMVIATRTVYITQNFQLNRAMAPYLLMKNERGEPARMGDFYLRGMNDLNDSNKLRYAFIGDPAITFPLPVNTVEVTSIGETDMEADPEVMPEIQALGRVEVKGTVNTPDGNVDEEFNGFIDLILFDAEKPISTANTGKGLDRVYNDRKTRLTNASARVENGRWSARLLLPSQIENNYSPALISAYAWNEKDGREAHGMTERLYVYGYDDEAEPDTKAPEIESFYLNSPAFANGNVVNSSPIVFATLSDESGINISDAGIGQQMLLTLDGSTHFTDINGFFTVDMSREGAGSICYPLEDIEPGKHTLTLSVWDNAGNSAKAELEFNVGAAVDPVITDLSTNVNPASTSVVFSVTVDRPNSNLDCNLEVFDLGGRRVWSREQNVTTDMQSVVTTTWNLCDAGGVRVPRGIYIYRATVKTPEGTYSSKSRKLAVTAQ